jgi:hypothetical protein
MIPCNFWAASCSLIPSQHRDDFENLLAHSPDFNFERSSQIEQTCTKDSIEES